MLGVLEVANVKCVCVCARVTDYWGNRVWVMTSSCDPDARALSCILARRSWKAGERGGVVRGVPRGKEGSYG